MDERKRDTIITSPTAERMLGRVSPIYDNSYVGLWIFEAIGKEYDKLWKIANELPDQLFPESATWGIELWERRYGITPTDGQTLEERRQRVLTMRSMPRPFNHQTVENYIRLFTGREAEIIDRIAPYTFAIKIENSGKLAVIDLVKAIKIINTKKPSHMSYVLQMDNKKSIDLYAGCAFYGSENAKYRVSSEEVPTLNWYADEDGDMLLDENGFPLIVED